MSVEQVIVKIKEFIAEQNKVCEREHTPKVKTVLLLSCYAGKKDGYAYALAKELKSSGINVIATDGLVVVYSSDDKTGTSVAFPINNGRQADFNRNPEAYVNDAIRAQKTGIYDTTLNSDTNPPMFRQCK